MTADPRVEAATSARIDAYVAQVLADAPSPSPELKVRVAERLRPYAEQPRRPRARRAA